MKKEKGSLKKECVYCGVPEKRLGWYKNQKRLSIDRKDSSLLYKKDNLVLACLACNRVKSDVFSFDEMKKLAELFIKKKWQSHE